MITHVSCIFSLYISSITNGFAQLYKRVPTKLMKELKDHYQNVVIGFGKGGKTLAAYLATQGQDVAVLKNPK